MVLTLGMVYCSFDKNATQNKLHFKFDLKLRTKTLEFKLGSRPFITVTTAHSKDPHCAQLLCQTVLQLAFLVSSKVHGHPSTCHCAHPPQKYYQLPANSSIDLSRIVEI